VKAISQITLNIKGRDWTFKLLTDKQFNKLHNKEDEGNTAMTIQSDYEVHFRKSDWSIATIRHELGHTLHMSSLVGSSDLTVSDTVELMCEIIGEHTDEIVLWSVRIAEKFINHS
jgi:hypothetical protein